MILNEHSNNPVYTTKQTPEPKYEIHILVRVFVLVFQITHGKKIQLHGYE